MTPLTEDGFPVQAPYQLSTVPIVLEVPYSSLATSIIFELSGVELASTNPLVQGLKSLIDSIPDSAFFLPLAERSLLHKTLSDAMKCAAAGNSRDEILGLIALKFEVIFLTKSTFTVSNSSVTNKTGIINVIESVIQGLEGN